MKKLLKRLFCLPPPLTLLIALPSFALVFFVLGSGMDNHIVTYVSYVLSTYAMIISVTGIRAVTEWIRSGIYNNPLTKKLLSVPLCEKCVKEPAFRTEISLYSSLTINFTYAVIKLFSGIYYRSAWFVSLAVYYISLSVMRFALLGHVRRAGENKAAELRRYRLCGVVLLVMNEALAGIIILAVTKNSGFEYPGLLIYAMAIYAFYAVISASVNLIKYRKYGSPVMSAAKVINLTAALVSILSLEMAMLTQFGAAEDPSLRRLMISCTGAGVCVIVLGMAVYMIHNATRKLKHMPFTSAAIRDKMNNNRKTSRR
ncbi:MAG: hypothetical protein ACI4DP_11905 [Candidatus Ornithomonoglobus sp.]